MLIYKRILILALIFKDVLMSKNNQVTSKIAELDNSICKGVKDPGQSSAKILLEDLRLFNSLFRKVKKAVLSTKEHELLGKKVQIAEIVLKSHPHFLQLQIDEARLKREGKWNEFELKSLNHLLKESQDLRHTLTNIIKSHNIVL